METILLAARNPVLPYWGLHEPVSALTHAIAAAASLWALWTMRQRGRGDKLRMAALMLYSFSLFALFTVSAGYHALHPGPLKAVLHRLDYAAIFLVIAGTMTPILVILIRGMARWGTLAAVWSVAFIGLSIIHFKFRQLPFVVMLGLYLGLGWMGVSPARRILANMGWTALKPFAFGGAVYTLGAIADYFWFPTIWPLIVGPHEVFHVAVVTGAAYHWWGIFNWADHPTQERLEFSVKRVTKRLLVARAAGERFRVFARSIPELKRKVAEKMKKRYHPSLRPAEVVFVMASAREVLRL